MFRYFLVLIFTFLLFSCSTKEKESTLYEKKIKNLSPDKSIKRTRKNREHSQRSRFQQQRLVNPSTKKIPLNIRKEELIFSKTIPDVSERGDILVADENVVIQAQTTDWEIEGPKNVGGRTRALAIDVSNNEIIIAGGITGGLYRSIDAGKNWKKSESAQNFMSVSTIAQDTREGRQNVWYYGTGEFIYVKPIPTYGSSALVGDGIYKSLDSGKSWFLLENTSVMEPQSRQYPFQAVKTIVVNPLNGDVLAATHGGLFLSTNGGETWERTLGNAERNGFYDIAVSPQGAYYATYGAIGEFSGVFQSSDGKNWTSLLETFPSDPQCFVSLGCYADVELLLNIERFSFYVSDIEVSPSNPDIIYFLLDLSSPYGAGGGYIPELFRYDKSQNQWEYGLLPNQRISPNFRTFNSQQGYNLSLAVHPEDENTVYVGGIDLFRSTDWFQEDKNTALVGGYSSDLDSYFLYPNHHPDIHVITFRNDKNGKLRLLTGSDGGIHETQNPTGENVIWDALNNGYYTTQFYGIDIDKSSTQNKRILGGMQDNGTYASIPKTKEWQEITGGDGGYPQYTSRGIEKFFTTSQYGYIFRIELKDEEYGIDHCFEESGYETSDYEFIAPIKTHPLDPGILFSAKKKQVLLNDKTTTAFNCKGNWEVFFSLPVADYSNTSISSLETSPSDPDVLFVGTSQGHLYKIRGVESGQGTLEERLIPSSRGGYISDITVNPKNINQIVVTYSNYEIPSVFYSEDGGKNWKDISFNLEEEPNGSGNGPVVYCSEVIPLSDGLNAFLVGTSTGIYSLLSNSTKWYHEGTNEIGYASITDILFRDEDEWVVASTFGSGVFSGNVSFLKKINNYLGEGEYLFGLANKTNYAEQYYSRELSFAFLLEESNDITIEIIDIHGRVLTTRTERNLPAGNYYAAPITISVGNIISGVYFASLKVNNERVSSKKILIL